MANADDGGREVPDVSEYADEDECVVSNGIGSLAKTRCERGNVRVPVAAFVSPRPLDDGGGKKESCAAGTRRMVKGVARGGEETRLSFSKSKSSLYTRRGLGSLPELLYGYIFSFSSHR